MTNQEIEKELNLITKICESVLNENLISIVLFGSIAREDAKAFSDIDICLVVKKYPSKDWKLSGIIKHKCFLEGISKPVEPIFLEEEDLKIPSPLLYELSRDGIVITGHDVLPELKKVSEQIKPIIGKGEKKIGWQTIG
jgi:predicted nucleotidyltransferase